MLTGLRTGFRFRLAVTLCALAAVCFALPPTALAIGHGADAADCLSHAEAVTHGVSHLHDGAKAHEVALPGAQDRGDHAPAAAGHQAHCCGVFCLSALVAAGGEVAIRDVAAASHFPAQEPQLLSRAPELPDRPPISLLVV